VHQMPLRLTAELDRQRVAYLHRAPLRIHQLWTKSRSGLSWASLHRRGRGRRANVLWCV
jgi:hypothetical protein